MQKLAKAAVSATSTLAVAMPATIAANTCNGAAGEAPAAAAAARPVVAAPARSAAAAPAVDADAAHRYFGCRGRCCCRARREKRTIEGEATGNWIRGRARMYASASDGDDDDELSEAAEEDVNGRPR